MLVTPTFFVYLHTKERMKHYTLLILSVLFVTFCLTSCQQEDEKGNGYLQLESPSKAQSSLIKVTRAVDESLCLDILNAEQQVVRAFAPGELVTPQKIELEEGEYSVRAYSPNYQVEYTGDEVGEPKYFVQQAFVIKPQRVTGVKCVVPMTNCAWELTDIEGLDSWVKAYKFEVKAGERTIQLKVGDMVYLEPGPTSYTLTLTNQDDEIFTHTGNREALAGKKYCVTYSTAPQQVCIKTE